MMRYRFLDRTLIVALLVLVASQPAWAAGDDSYLQAPQPLAGAQELPAPRALQGEEPGMAEAEAEVAAGDAISAAFGVDIASHFISYGYDIWGGGTGWNRGTIQVWGNFTIDFDYFSITLGAWSDNNKNVTSAIGGSLQEVDVYAGIAVPIYDFTLGVTYQEWIYGGGVEEILDLSIAYDDSGLWKSLFGEDFPIAFGPSFVAHRRLAASNVGGDSNGWAFVFSVKPSIQVIDSERFPVTVAVPIAIAFGDDDFYAVNGFGFVNAGVSVSMPIGIIPSKFGDWSVAFTLLYWHTGETAIGNPKDDFVTGMLSFSVAVP